MAYLLWAIKLFLHRFFHLMFHPFDPLISSISNYRSIHFWYLLVCTLFCFNTMILIHWFRVMGFWIVTTTLRDGETFSYGCPQPHDHIIHKGILIIPFQKKAITTIFYTVFIIMTYILLSDFSLEGILFH